MRDQVIRRLGLGVTGLLSAPGTVIAHAATKAGSTPTFGNPALTVAKMLLLLAAIVALVILLIRFLAKKVYVQQKGGIDVLAARQLAPNRSVQVIAVGDNRYLIGVGDEVTMLADVTDEYLPESTLQDADADSDSFGSVLAAKLAQVRKKYSGASPSKESDE